MVDESGLTNYYSEIANKLDEMIPCEWEKVYLYAEETGDVSTGSFYFYTSDSKVHWSEEIPKEFEIDKAEFREIQLGLWQINESLWLEFQNQDESTWYAYIFELDSEWKFKIRYLYDKDDSLTSTQRRIRWAYEELNIIPNGGYGRKLLKEYLEEQGRELPEELKKC